MANQIGSTYNNYFAQYIIPDSNQNLHISPLFYSRWLIEVKTYMSKALIFLKEFLDTYYRYFKA